MVFEDECQPASIRLREYVELFLQSGSNSPSPAGNKIVVKCNLTHLGVLRFSKVFRGGENKGENAELQLAKELKVLLAEDKYWPRGGCEIKVISNKSPSIISAEQFVQVLRQIRGKLGSGSPVTFTILYAHPCHYVNQRALSNLHRAGIKLAILKVEDILVEAIRDATLEVKGLARLPCQRLRGLRVEVDCTMLASAHFLLANAYEINGLTLAERTAKSNFTPDVYVQKLKQELKKLQGISRGRVHKRQNAVEHGRRSSSLDPYRQSSVEFHTVASQAALQKSPKKTAKGNQEDSFWHASAHLTDHASLVMLDRTLGVIKSIENGNQEICLSLEMYRTDYILNGGPNKSSKTKAIDGKWTIHCFTNDEQMFYQEQGLILKNAYEDANTGLSDPQLYKNVAGILTSSGEKEIVVEIEVVITSLPDKNNFLRSAIQFAEKLSTLKETDSVVLVGYFAGMETFSMPSKQALKKMLKIGENGKNKTLAVALKPLHLQVILNMMIGDLLIFLSNFHSTQETRGVTVKVRPSELSAAMHLIRSSVKLTNGTNVASITDDSLHLRLVDKHFKHCQNQLENILSTPGSKG